MIRPQKTGQIGQPADPKQPAKRLLRVSGRLQKSAEMRELLRRGDTKWKFAGHRLVDVLIVWAPLLRGDFLGTGKRISIDLQEAAGDELWDRAGEFRQWDFRQNNL